MPPKELLKTIESLKQIAIIQIKSSHLKHTLRGKKIETGRQKIIPVNITTEKVVKNYIISLIKKNKFQKAINALNKYFPNQTAIKKLEEAKTLLKNLNSR